MGLKLKFVDVERITFNVAFHELAAFIHEFSQ
jgi:hypothetical protein